MAFRQPVAFYCICLGVGFVGVLASMVPVFSDAEESLGLDLLYQLRGTEQSRANVAIVAIDKESAGALDLPLRASKWPRQLHARLLERLTVWQAAVIAFDLFFYEPKEEAGDRILASAMERAGNVVLTQAIDRQTLSLPVSAGGRAAHVNIERMLSTLPILADAAVGQAPFPLPKVPVKLNQFWCFWPGSGNVPTTPVVALHVYAGEVFIDFIHLLREVDAVAAETLLVPETGAADVRRMIGLIQPLRNLFANDATLASRALERLARYSPQTLSADAMQLMRAMIRLYATESSRYLNFYGPPGTVRTIPYHCLVSPAGSGCDDDEAALLNGAAVFVGQTASNWIETHDSFYTAFSGKSGKDISGVEIAATALANLLEDKAVYPLAPFVNVLLLVGWGVLVALTGLHFTTAVSAAGLLLINGIYLCLACFQFRAGGIWYPLVVPMLVQTPTALIAGLIWKYRKVNIDRANIREAFGHYLPDEVVDRLSANLKELSLGGKVFYGVCLFTDAQNYTALSERLDPGRLTELMNRYYEVIFKPIKAHGGLVLQVVGDSVMALWSAPEPRPELSRAACRAAREVSAAVDDFNRQAGDKAMPTRIGMHAGEMLLGNIGAMDHYEYRPVGDIVNTASRVEGLNKFLGTHLLATREAMGAETDRMSRLVGWFVFKGKSRPVQVYELLDADSFSLEQQALTYRHFEAGLDAFGQRRWDAALKRFDLALQIDASDGPSRYYRRYCQVYREQPPDEAWDGAMHLEQK
ncbi:CHASE2 domain-containing protein [Desulfosarcina ovata]|uniref:Guanylate cyclase domain-containing protein n=1 Tax=Desulfosarcina ovata subsp. ovata TaxID=2752305 RepID=A0A5K8AJW6_9BACT|nr:adenylate/guanylate cyclase domain-containing protein [Desulfosarcina ovata]BBO92992.1 hypothetical protein DSCOOX_61720 [Desulfosarcina ovata subsp. ovata]